MLHFRYVVVVGSFLACSVFACGEKLNPKGDMAGTTGEGGSTDTGGIDGSVSEAGAGIDGTDGTTTAPVTYSKTIAPMMATYCATASCHSGSDPFALDTYAGVKATVTLAVGAIQSGNMPPVGWPSLPASDLNKLQAWVAAGELNN